ncbi:MAG: GlsB/YeaQ/YmgE family stress response membrane protein [Polyangiales bacterium]
MGFLMFAIFGLIIGAIAKFIMPGRDPGGIIVTAVIGMVGSLLGGYLGRVAGLYNDPAQGAGWAMSLIGALVLLGIYRLVVGRSNSA